MSATGAPDGAPRNPFVREGHVDKAGIVGSHWWNRELSEATALRSRRTLLTVLGASAAGIGVLGFAAFKLAEDDTREERRASLEMQRDFGWNFGATTETVAFQGAYTTSYAAGALPRLASELTPRSEALRRWYVPALFQSPSALPRSRLPDPEPGSVSLASALKPIHTPEMVLAEAKGQALAELLAQVSGGRVAVVFDLDGPESVAAAAGAADLLDPVFLFENWPHPRGVVPAHMTLAAAVYYQPRFAKAFATRPSGALPAFVLDRKRLSPYSDDAAQFDNRWLARLPLAADLTALEIKRVLYVVKTQAAPLELRDTGEALHRWAAAGLDVRALSFEALMTSAADGKVRFGATPETHSSFFAHYPWKPPPPPPLPPPPLLSVASNDAAARWRPQAPLTADPGDKQLGTIRVDVDRETAAVVGPHMLRSGSWNRSSGGWGG